MMKTSAGTWRDLTEAVRQEATDRTWSREWADWRDAAGWPKEHGTFHALRHFFATTLITNHAEPQDVQRMLRHKTARITLET
ncbi:tyrosine-type recombinase/integrase [Micromonospora kangleipakensis]|uniref:tyrosine-type recombinase/integrase n=1 Tax=Micromonospora kangleipakensis TaxID=1077942 RepID=UPI001F5FDCA5|nr:tyrosine-type recombinase/integrase [Micromonospora kangleipakensis]